MPRQYLKPLLFSTLFLFSLVSVPVASAADTSPPKTAGIKPAKIAGKWRIAWDVRLGTTHGVLDIKQNGSQVTGTFFEELINQTYSLSGTLQGEDITFDVDFPGGTRPYMIEFKGTVDGKKKMMTGTSALKGGGRVFLGHANEIVKPERPWVATKGMKPLSHSGKPPKDDDD
jgi:hypothetical protein